MSNNNIKIIDIEQIEGKIIYKYELNGSWKKYFNDKEHFYLNYDYNIEDIPYSIAAIPFISNIIVLAWICEAEIILEELDNNFYKSINKIREEFIKIYPTITFGKATFSTNFISQKTSFSKSSASLFSGGADAFFTLLRHIEENPTLITYQWLDENKNKIKSRAKSTAQEFNTNSICADTNVRSFLNRSLVDELVYSTNNTFWHNMQHGIGLLGMAAPVTHKKNIGKLYIASTYMFTDKLIACASNPITDNLLVFGNTRVIHDGENYSRQEKISYICNFFNELRSKIVLGVCAHSTLQQVNCNKCMKCNRTILEIASEGYNPRNFGFDPNRENIRRIKNNILFRHKIPDIKIKEFFIPVQNRFINNKDIIDNYYLYKWIENINFLEVENSFIKKFYQKLKLYKNRINHQR